jgi:hypothetical protein
MTEQKLSERLKDLKLGYAPEMGNHCRISLSQDLLKEIEQLEEDGDLLNGLIEMAEISRGKEGIGEMTELAAKKLISFKLPSNLEITVTLPEEQYMTEDVCMFIERILNVQESDLAFKTAREALESAVRKFREEKQ